MAIILALATALVVFLWLSLSRAGRSETWSAMVSPLASIIGSGFLVSAPLLARHFGSYAILAMGLLLLMAAAFGSAVRHNIGHVQSKGVAAHVHGLDRLSELALAFAYVVSVGYYLTLLGSFVTKLALGQPDPDLVRWIATVLVALIAWLGWSGGLRKVIRMESHVVAFKLAVIAGFLAALGWHAVAVVSENGPAMLVPLPGRIEPTAVPVLLGLLIVVQGFETSRYIGEEFDAPTRIRTMRLAQWVAVGIYLVFFALMLPLLPQALEGAGETAIIGAAAAVGVLLPLMLTFGAVASQFSAAVADAIGGAGLASELTRNRVCSSQTFPVFAAAVIVVLWTTDIYGIIVLASRIFALYYMLQCLVAAAEVRCREGLSPRVLWFAALAALAGAVVIFGVPAE